MAKVKSSQVASLAFKMATGVFGRWWYRRDNNAINYSADYNVGTWYHDRWCSDCLGFVHVAVNGFKGDKNKVGGGAVMDDFVWNSDEATTLNKYCSVRGGFPKKNPKPATLLQTGGHVGLYIGENFASGYNMAECTLADNHAYGATLSWIDMNTGIKYNKKGGYRVGYFNNWGEFDRVDYTSTNSYPATPFEVTVLINDLTIRSGPGTSYSALGTMPSGKAKIYKRSGDWGQITSESKWIYIGNSEWVKIGGTIPVEKSPFSDVAVTYPKYSHIKACYDAGLIKGYADGTFKPKDPFLREDACIVLNRLMEMLSNVNVDIVK